ncbi:SusD/RagB family nutrient-binding outer membrane lipoprotein [Flagellimonas sp. CMM7]|uniref:SusD/RagB family nutrient-binding outer membrane lipoprotein n=1 Tax=Flagellimonas sp. CMM7 TaxID=2654676 RepID=UPI0013D58FEF|nr:SusD/RagB family nutrient-binding outer membrane lipoprotein [Flagellimonas sp. CMM7]UII79038.1 SusD/RagB family nutrient-binding outer membrane lipoprotein [Flagellimonas sp. CMM7]
MRKQFLNSTIKIFTILLFIGCSDEYFDINTPSNTAIVDQLRMQDLIGPVILSTVQGQRSAELAFGNYVQNFVINGGGAAGQTTASALWEEVYLYVLPNLKVIKDKATENNAPHISAIADILTAINIGIATDTWDNIPFSEASEAPENTFPVFDTQESIYNQLFSILDNAIAALEGPDNSNITLGESDIVYGGDIEKWLRTAYTVKARYQLHLVNKGVVSANDVLVTIENGYGSAEDDFLVFFDERNINPWYSEEILARATGNFSNDIASQLVSSMNGDYFPFESGIVTIDPRLPLFAQNDGAEEYKGYVSGSEGLAPDGTDANTSFRTDGYYTSIDSPLLLISYAEAKFIEAEAAFIANGGTTTSTGSSAAAYSAYLEGIQASMDMYEVDGADYLGDTAIAVGEDELMLNHIMKEKYIHNFLNPETFVDFRRYDFSDDVFVGLQIRQEEASNDSDFFGQWFRRAEYPATELNRNEENVLANQETPVTPVWWDR